jgi:hypothetical protein
MNRARLFTPLLALLLAALFLPAALFANQPAILAPQAAAIAQADLESRGLEGEVYIADMRYKKGTFGSSEHWEVLWSKSFPANTEGRSEIGIKVTMDGSYTRTVR